MLKHLRFSHSCDILGSDSPQSNNRSPTEGNSILAAVAGIGVSHRLTSYKTVIFEENTFFWISNILAKMSHAQLISHTVIKKLWTFFRPWGRDRSRVKQINPGLTPWLDKVLEFDLKMACAKFQRNRFRIVEDIDVIKHALQIYLNNCGPWQAYR